MFGDLFLSILAVYKLHNIRSLHYTISSPSPTAFHPFYGGYLDGFIETDFSGARKLGQVLLKHIDSLNSLEKVVICAETSDDDETNESWKALFDDLTLEGHAEEIWKDESDCKQWDLVAQTLQSKTRSGVLRGFDVLKETIAWVHDDNAIYHVHEKTITFSKPINFDPSAPGKTGITTYDVLEEWLNY